MEDDSFDPLATINSSRDGQGEIVLSAEDFAKLEALMEDESGPTPAMLELFREDAHCDACGAEYVHHQHPMKPLGVIMASTCQCKVTIESSGAKTRVTLIPPGQPR